MADLAWMLFLPAALLWMLDLLLPKPGAKDGRQVRRAGFRVPRYPVPAPGTRDTLTRPAAAPLTEETARRMVEHAYASSEDGENEGTTWKRERDASEMDW